MTAKMAFIIILLIAAAGASPAPYLVNGTLLDNPRLDINYGKMSALTFACSCISTLLIFVLYIIRKYINFMKVSYPLGRPDSLGVSL